MASKKKTKKKGAKKKSPARKKKSVGLGKVPKKVTPSLDVKPLGSTADGKLKIFQATVKAAGNKLELGVITAANASAARRKAKTIAAKTFKF